MDLVFVDYEVLPDADTKRIRIHVQTPNPDADQNGRSDAYVELTDAQITALGVPATPPNATQQTAFWNLVTTELSRVYRKNLVRTRLDPMIGTTRVV